MYRNPVGLFIDSQFLLAHADTHAAKALLGEHDGDPCIYHQQMKREVNTVKPQLAPDSTETVITVRISLFSKVKTVPFWLFWYDRMLGASLDDWLENLKKMNDEEFCLWQLQRQEKNSVLTHLMDEYVNYTYY